MARLASMTYDPYSYYTCPLSHSSISSHSLTLADKLDLELFANAVKPRSAYPSPTTRSRKLSVCSTASVCSADSEEDEGEEDDMLHSPLSPVDTASTCSTFSSCRTSRSSAFYFDSNTMASPQSSSSPSSGRIQRPRGPRPRPLPSLPTHSPSPKLVPNIQVTVPSTPPLALRLKLASPPPSYAEATQSALASPASPSPYPWAAVRPDPAALPAQPGADTIDWERVEAYMMAYNDG